MNDLKNREAPAASGADASSPNGAKTDPKPRVSSDVLLAGCHELVIDHEGEEYRLRRTSKGKLILTK